MKKGMKAALLALALLFAAGSAARARQTKKAPAPAAKLQVTQCALAVKGMHCAMCPAMVKARLLKLAGVKAAAVDYKTGRAAVEYEAKETSPGKIVAEFNKANSGYRVTLANYGGAKK